MGLTRQEPESFRGVSVPNLIGPNVTLLLVGLTPSLWAAATKTPFAHPGYPASSSPACAGSTHPSPLCPPPDLVPPTGPSLEYRSRPAASAVGHSRGTIGGVCKKGAPSGASSSTNTVPAATPTPATRSCDSSTGPTLAAGTPHSTTRRRPDTTNNANPWITPG